MKAMKRYIVFLPVFVWAIFFAGAEVKVENASIHRSGDSIRVSFKILVPSGTIASDYVQRLIPVIENGVDSLALDEIEIIGKRKQKLRRREAVLSGKTYEVPFYQTVDGGELQYDCVLPYEKWMGRAPVDLSLLCEREGCCKVEPLPGIFLCSDVKLRPPYVPSVQPVALIPSVAERLAEVEKVLFPMAEYEPYSDSMTVWRDRGALKVYFPLDKSDLRRDYRNNDVTLGRIVDILRQIYADDRSDVGKILIVGFASPEGPLGRNTRLAGARADVLKEYVNSYLELPDSLYEVANGGEAWGELRDRVEESTFDCRDEMLDIIDHTADLGRREWLLRRLDGGEPFKELLRSVFSDQRNSGYMRVYYTSEPDYNAIKINQAQGMIAEGDFDGRFSVTVDENDRAELRYDHLEIYAGGELMRTLEVRQQAPAPAIATNFTEKQVAASAASFDVLVTCNAEWRAEVSPEDEAWLSLGERTATRLNVVCAVNDTGASREGAVRLYIPGTACEVSLAVKQSNN